MADTVEKTRDVRPDSASAKLDAGLKCVRGSIPLILLCAVLCAAGVFAYRSFIYKPGYRAYMTFTVLAEDNSTSSGRYYNAKTAEQLASTFPYIISSGPLGTIAAQSLGYETLPCAVTAQAEGESSLFTMSAVSTDPVLAYEVLRAVAESYPKVADYVIGPTNLAVLDESGVPETPYTDFTPASAVIAGAAAGAFIPIVLCMAAGMARTTVRTQNELSLMFGVSCFGSVPMVTTGRGKNKKSMAGLSREFKMPSAFVGAIRIIRTKLVSYAASTGAKTFLVTSTLSGEGKTTLSLQLSLALAEEGYNVVLIDGDLRSPSIGKLVDVKTDAGLSDYLTGSAKGQSIIASPVKHLRVIPGKKPVGTEAAELIACENMRSMLRSLSAVSDFIIIDTPPCAMISDAQALAPYTDATVLVVRQDHARTQKIFAAVQGMSDAGAVFAGTVFNAVSSPVLPGRRYGYGYGYGHYGYGYGHYGYGYGYGYGGAKQSEVTGYEITPAQSQPEEGSVHNE